MPYYTVEIQPGCWLADVEGDPGRTLVQGSASRYGSIGSAEAALTAAREYRPLPRARIVEARAPCAYCGKPLVAIRPDEEEGE